MHIKQIYLQHEQTDVDSIERACLAKVEASTPEGSTYSLTTSLANPLNKGVEILSNIWRIEQASLDGNMFYIDSDAFVAKWPSFPKSGKPYFVQTNLGKVGCFAFYANGCTDFFASILDEVKRSPTPWTITDILNKHRDEVEVFSSDCIHHLCLSNTKRNFLEFGDGKVSVKKIDGVWTLMGA